MPLWPLPVHPVLELHLVGALLAHLQTLCMANPQALEVPAGPLMAIPLFIPRPPPPVIVREISMLLPVAPQPSRPFPIIPNALQLPTPVVLPAQKVRNARPLLAPLLSALSPVVTVRSDPSVCIGIDAVSAHLNAKPPPRIVLVHPAHTLYATQPVAQPELVLLCPVAIPVSG